MLCEYLNLFKMVEKAESYIRQYMVINYKFLRQYSFENKLTLNHFVSKLVNQKKKTYKNTKQNGFYLKNILLFDLLYLHHTYFNTFMKIFNIYNGIN